MRKNCTAKKSINKYILTVTCLMSSFPCNLSPTPTATATDPPPANYQTMHGQKKKNTPNEKTVHKLKVIYAQTEKYRNSPIIFMHRNHETWKQPVGDF